MADIFLKIVNMSISASWIVLAVLLLRLLLKRAPKWINILLWGVVAVRLIFPFSIESVISLIPSTETISPEIMMDKTPTINSGVPIINNIVNPVIGESFAPDPIASANPLQILIPVLAIAWIVGIVVMLAYTVISYFRVKSKIGTAVLLRDNIYQSENVVSPFVLGIIKPKIFLAFDMNEQDMEHVIAHENAHIRRKDHLWKPIGFLLLTIHWFNPMAWIAYVFLCRDIELACDEKVIKEMQNEQRANYSQALLNCSVNRRMISACPLAFGEVGIKVRVKSVMSYKRPAFWIIIISVIACIAVAIFFLTDPKEKTQEISWPALEEIREGYSQKDATADGCVVFDGHTLLAGEKQWINFVNETNSGKSSAVRIYQSYSDQENVYYVKELSYDGEKYHLKFYDRTGDTNEEFLFESSYSYLIRSPYSNEDTLTDCYLLADSSEVTAEGFWNSILSSTIKPEYQIYNNCHMIYGNVITDSQYLLNSHYGTVFYDIDNDGKEDKVCLGMGQTSGIFTFTVTVYNGNEIKYNNVFHTEFYYLSFQKNEKGVLQVKGVTQGYPPETHIFDIIIKDGKIDLLER